MPISVVCSACGKVLKAKDSLAGKTAACPNCGQKVLIANLEDDAGTYLLESGPPSAAPKPYSPPRLEKEAREPDVTPHVLSGPPAVKPPVAPAPLPPLTTNELPLWRRHLHWLLVLALLPLAWSLLGKDEDKDDFEKRFVETIKQAPPEAQERIIHVLQILDERKVSRNDLLDALPDQKLIGALLPRKTLLHWAFAAGAALLFMTFFLLLAHQQTAEPAHLLAIGLFTATVGILFLFVVQWLAGWTQGVWLHGRGITIILFYIVKFISFSYEAAAKPDNGFLLSFLGFTCGVGLCEEVCKALPLLWYYRAPRDQNWRGAFLWGLASGAGFGIAEGIIYSGSFYNGVGGPGIYVVRFVSCVALHALWTGSVAITLNQRQELIQGEMSWYEFIPPVLVIVGIPMVLHGLYDTVLKKNMNAFALIVAVASFLFLAFQISQLHSEDDETAKEGMLREYQRRKERGL